MEVSLPLKYWMAFNFLEFTLNVHVDFLAKDVGFRLPVNVKKKYAIVFSSLVDRLR